MIFQAYAEFDLGYTHFRIEAPTPMMALDKLSKWLENDEREFEYLELYPQGKEPVRSDPINEDDLEVL